MSKQQLDLTVSKRRSQPSRDQAALEAAARGEKPLAEALGLTDDDVAGLQRQARTLFDTQKHERCAQVLEALIALQRFDAEDVLQLALCYQALGNHEKAALWMAQAHELLRQLEAQVIALREGRDA